MATLPPAPLKRLSRPQDPPGFRITERDAAILRAVARFRFLSSEQVARIIGGSERALRVRLKLLFYHGYLDRPRHQHVQLAMFFDEGNRPLVYGLARRGAQLLAEHGAVVDAKLDWTTKNARATSHFLAHTLEVANAMIGFEQACGEYGALQLIDHHALLPYFPAARRVVRDPFRCRVDVRHGNATVPIGVVPDRLFSFAYTNGTRHNFALELDRGSMDIKARQLAGKSSFRRKLLGYFHAWRQKRHTEAWGFQSFRILTITPSYKRIESMLAAQREITNDAASGLFLYTTLERLAVHGPLGNAWINATDNATSLLG